MYDCGLLRRGGIVGRHFDYNKQSWGFQTKPHTSKRAFPPLRSPCQAAPWVYTGVCVCVDTCGCERGTRTAYVHTWLSINIADEQYRNKCQDTGRLRNKSD